MGALSEAVGPSWRASLTAGRRRAARSSAGQAASSSCRRARRGGPASRLGSGSRITGIRSWSRRARRWPSVVMIVQIRIFASSVAVPDRPQARRRRTGAPSARVMWNGCLRPGAVGPRLPLVEAVGDDQAAAALERVAEGGLLGDGLGPRVDHLVADLVGSLAQDGTRPQRSSSPRGSPSLDGGDRDTSSPGATLKRCRTSSDSPSGKRARRSLAAGRGERVAPAHRPSGSPRRPARSACAWRLRPAAAMNASTRRRRSAGCRPRQTTSVRDPAERPGDAARRCRCRGRISAMTSPRMISDAADPREPARRWPAGRRGP